MGDLRLRGRGTGRRSAGFAVPECRHRRGKRVGQDAPFVRFRDRERLTIIYRTSESVSRQTRTKRETSRSWKWRSTDRDV